MSNITNQDDPDAWKRAPSVQIAEEKEAEKKEAEKEYHQELRATARAINAELNSKDKKAYVDNKMGEAKAYGKNVAQDAKDNASSPLSVELAGACQRGEQDLKQSSAYSQAGGWSRSGPASNGPERSASLDTGLGMERDGPDFPK